MKRLIYAPKVYVFVRCSNLIGYNSTPIRDLSADVVSGSITRNVNNLSTAEVVLKNRFFKHIKDEQTGRSVFLPMDLITIWLQRVAGKPIQVFTGYLDSVPYYQMYPGNCILKASCTLKKLKYTWFDPGLPTFASWLKKKGWTYNPDTGESNNWPNEMNRVSDLNPTDPKNISGKQINDSGYGQLLYDFMTDSGYAGWDKEQVRVSNIPSSFIDKALTLYKDTYEEKGKAREDLQNLLKSMMTIQVNPAIISGDAESTQLHSPEVAIVQTIKDNAGNIPPRVLVYAAIAGSNLTASYQNTDSNSNNPGYGYGLFALRPETAERTVVIGPVLPPTISGKTIDEILDPKTSIEVFKTKLSQALNEMFFPNNAKSVVRIAARKAFIEAVEKGDNDKTAKWIEKALGHYLTSAQISLANQNTSSILTSNTGVNTNAARAQNFSNSVAGITWDIGEFNKDSGNKVLDDQKEFEAVNKYKSANPLNHNLARIAYTAKASYSSLYLRYYSDLPKDVIALEYKRPDVRTEDDSIDFIQRFDKKESVDYVVYGTFTAGGYQLTYARGRANTESGKNFADSLQKNNLLGLHPAHIFIKVSSTADLDFLDDPVGTTADQSPSSTPAEGSFDNNQVGGMSLSQLAQFSFNAAFASQFAFPTNKLRSETLTGDRALMNDVSCYDAVSQFCQASLRNFMSLPDGSFLAFYPDYFGANGRKPYWPISDMEIVNMGIQHNDGTFATHVYTIGDRFPDSTSDKALMNEASSMGVVTIANTHLFEAFISGTIAGDSGDDLSQFGGLLTKLKNGYDIIRHYGARPHREDFPLIRNGIYEFLLAYQKFMQLWASQFSTIVEFTFQPEVFAGGLIGFPEHGIQVYVESVTHSWDYTSGFNTEAVISSPSIMEGYRDKFENKYPGFALAGTMSVGA